MCGGDALNKKNMLAEVERLRSTLLLMDTTYRAERNKYTPVELSDTLKALRMLALSVESGGLDACFAMDALTESKKC